MLSLHNVSKTYVTKSKTQTQALKEINLEIASQGMVFILGKSGSGKSTLLNLLGGLDSPTSGEIYVDGESMQKFTASDYAAYRNNYVGFIFQEFNLLADFNVRDNVALALNLTKADNVDEKVSQALKQVELDDNYLKRRIGEMSGGEKQRIAIARALIKDSKLILADEPTGNLDSATGESIWNILKGLSRERLVVVVSHDRESAEKYADRIIEISDGTVISDSGVQPVSEEQPAKQDGAQAETIIKTKSRLFFMTRLKMGFNNLRLRKIRTACVILVAIFSIFSVIITQMCLSYSPEVALTEYIEDNGVEYFTLSGSVSKNRTKRYIAENCNYINHDGHYGLIESKQDVLDFGLSFVGDALELDDNSYYITVAELERCYDYAYVEVGGNYVKLYRPLHTYEYLIGKKVTTNLIDKGYTLAGIIDTERYFDSSLYTYHYSVFPYYFHTKNFVGASFGSQFTIYGNRFLLQLGDNGYGGSFTVRRDYSFDIVLTADGIINKADDLQLADDEIILPYEIYAQLFPADSKWSYVSSDLTSVLNTPKEIGQTFSLSLCEYDTGETVADYKQVKLAGVMFEKYVYDTSVPIILMNKSLYWQLYMDYSYGIVLIQTSSVKNLSSFVTTLNRKYNCEFFKVQVVDTLKPTTQQTYYVEIADQAYGFEESLERLSIAFIAAGAILVVILVLLVINLISFTITNRKKEIGILSAIGTSNKDIVSMFLIETAIIAAITFVLVLIMSFAFAAVANVVFSRYLYDYIVLAVIFPVLRVDILTVAVLALSSFGLLLLAALIPLRKVIKLKPIDAIRNI